MNLQEPYLSLKSLNDYSTIRKILGDEPNNFLIYIERISTFDKDVLKVP
jgi:hypothetical protein